MQAIDITTAIANEYQIDPAIFTAFVEYERVSDLEDAADMFNDQFTGIWANAAAWAEEMLAGTGELDAMPERLQSYFDYAKYARDCELSGDIWTIETNEGTAVFWNR